MHIKGVSYKGELRWSFDMLYTFNFPIEEETFAILGESDNCSNGIKASVILFAP